MKKIVFCFDGTCNDPEDSGDFFEDSSVSNILKLHAFLGGSLRPMNGVNSKTPNQRSFYYSGIGTRGNWLKQKFNSMFAPPYGDMDDILDEARSDLDAQDYQDGDEIYIFGFSRGAAIARMFAADIGKKIKRIKFLGVFDTVAATKGSLDLNPETYPASGIVFENGTIGKSIERAVHLVSIDEKRLAFQPTLFNKDERVTEVWFAGVHSDVGGGYWFDGLSDISLEFMLSCIRADLQVLAIEDIGFETLKVIGAQDAICDDDLNIVPLSNGKIHEQKRAGIQAKTLSPRLVRVNIDDHPAAQEIPVIHHSVSERFHKVTEYRPYALRDTRFYIMDKNGEVGDELKGVAKL
jgi:pimeloyl-ACP methyl ester carboxylesterase